MVSILKKQLAQLPSHYVSSGIIVITHFVGVFGLSSAWRDLFLAITPLQLLLVFGILIKHQEVKSKAFLVFIVIITIVSYIVEVIGVNTGNIFGNYEYGNALGIKIINTPLLIGILWFILINSVGTIVAKWKINFLIQSLVGAGLMVIIDFVIEPVAIELGFWAWEDNLVPLRNYFAWFMISFAFFIMYFKLSFSKRNQVAPVVYGSQLLFFAAINVL